MKMLLGEFWGCSVALRQRGRLAFNKRFHYYSKYKFPSKQELD